MSVALKRSLELSPIAAYNAIATYYDSLLQAKEPYLRAIDDLVVAHSRGASSLLDVGAGNGFRALRIARAAGIENVVLLEPSAGMRAQCRAGVEFWNCQASEIPDTARKFDLITCLWNVLGHLEDAAERARVLARLRMLLSPTGTIFVDVNHRYNARAYGWTKTAGRIVRDFFLPEESNGDVIASWQAGDTRICTRGHVFTQAELGRIFLSAGLKIRNRWVIDYTSGDQRRFAWQGNLFYQLAP